MRNARTAEPELFAAGVALAQEERFVPLRPINANAPDADRSPNAATHGDSDGVDEDDTDHDTRAEPGGGDVEGESDEDLREEIPVATVPVAPVLDEDAIEQIVSRLLDARIAQQAPAPEPVSEARIQEMVELAVRQREIPAPTFDQSVVDTAVQDALARCMPGALEAMQAETSRTAEELGRQHAEQAARVVRLREELAAAERDVETVRLREEAAKLVQAAVAKITAGRAKR